MKHNFQPQLCELCNHQANLYCTSDKAFLCFRCDLTVHNANFLVARHLRRLVCSSCRSLSEQFFSGHCSLSLESSLCRSCSPEEDSSSTVSSACVSSTERRKPRRGEVKFKESEGVFGKWCKKLGQNGDFVISKAREAMEICEEKMWPSKLSLAASFWHGLGCSGNATRQNLRVLEKVSGLSGKLIVGVELKVKDILTVRMRMNSRRDLEEGWAECN